MDRVQAPGYDWLSSGGAYAIILIAWVLSAAFFSIYGNQALKQRGVANDGCLLAICCFLLALCGGGVGLFLGLQLSHYPTFVITSLIGCILFPAVGSHVLIRKFR